MVRENARVDLFSTELLVAGVTGVGGVLTVILTSLTSRDKRKSITQDLAILKTIDEQPHADWEAARDALRSSLVDRIRDIAGNSDRRRNGVGIVLGVLFLVSGISLGVYVVTSGGWWHVLWPVVVTLTLFGWVGGWGSLKKVPRTSTGSEIKADSKISTEQRKEP
ncbi:hypothetical protein [Pseudoclavibacter sp. VKM Ac-2867]|uniref:hypothetical protein n=1 Tax=Pseudoclavibacter sp. VKM Ac-2867 TaxID=2783829 RepID=UPI00188A7CBC|nr:hypothetical protein [Pseudoclavibacter sp. VKM Ac-2867]MBF4460347.1 hypothetical protein [Pseudoclavibacter sp. VKM Ac-2867]